MGLDRPELRNLSGPAMAYYRATFTVLTLFFLVCVAGFVTASLWSARQRVVFTQAVYQALQSADQRSAAEAEERARDQQVRPVREFVNAWEPYLRPAPPKDLGNHLRNGLATLATRTGLTSEGATVPGESRPYAVGGSVIKVQQVSLNVIGESLPAVITWLGVVESQYAYARVESLTLSAYGSRSVQLAITLLHPIEESTTRIFPAPLAMKP